MLPVASFAANNPANLITNHQPCPELRFVKVAYDGGPRFLLGIMPAGEGASVSLCQWQSEDNSQKQTQVVYARKMTPCLEAAVNLEKWDGRANRQDLVGDIHTADKKYGLAVWIPMQGENNLLLGPRIKKGEITLFSTMGKEVKPLVGINYCHNKLSIDLAHGQENTWVRISKPNDNIIPEIRIKWNENDTFAGLGIGLCL